ncbi:MAG: glycoside hydrolase family 3 N-terminal domain-containing protein [Bacteroidales bacterium]|jgi:beta-glucosidase
MRTQKLLQQLSLFAIICTFCACTGKISKIQQPVLGNRTAKIIESEGLKFKDLNKNGKLDKYEDWRLPVEERIADLISKMTLEEKVGLMFHPNISVPADGKVKFDLTDEEKAVLASAGKEIYAGPIGPGGQKAPSANKNPGQMSKAATAKSFIVEKNFRCILNNGVAAPREFANWSNQMQEIAENTRLGIPIVFSSDPRHGAVLGAHVDGVQYFSQWPNKEGQVGITASRDTDLMKEFGAVVAEEYRAVGLHMILGPQIDVITEPRWDRNMGCFSEDANLTAEMLSAFMDGAQGKDAGPAKILVHLKHWPGSGPHKGGTGLWLVYPGNNLDYHLIPFKKGIEKGALAVMGYYSGTYHDTLNVCFSPYFSTELLYNKLGFKGAICTDWGVVGGIGPMNPRLKGKTTLKDNMHMVINAGVDQMGVETDNQLVVELVKEGKITEERINKAAAHILQWHVKLGLFENPYVDAEAAVKIVNSEKNQKLGYKAQLESVILLSNNGVLPAKEKCKLYIEGIEKEIAAKYAEIVDNPAKADLILVRTPTYLQDEYSDAIESAKKLPAFAKIKDTKKLVEAVTEVFTNGLGPDGQRIDLVDMMGAPFDRDISFPADKWASIKKLAKTGVPVVVAFNPTGSGVVLPADLKEITKASLMLFDVQDSALLDVVFGRFNPVARLPFEIPSSMEAVKKQLEDVPFDSKDPAFKYGDGLSFNK